ncbi:hypothetical protein BD413DRAFT_613421 [Trametes elegans]|nr:hypothetical protein BD413DRAFT_613421 [Trametes elegans]
MSTAVGDEPVKVVRKRPFRSATIALERATASVERFGIGGKARRSGKKEDPVLSINTKVESVADLVSPLASGAQASAVKVVQYGSNALVEGLPELLKVLKDIAAVHPFIQLAVGAFEVAIELDMKRRENDKRINLLLLEMRDMMTALVDLQQISDPAHVGKDGKTVQERLEGFVNLINDDIKDCANACDAYAKKTAPARVFGAPIWDSKLQQYVKRFTKRRADIEFALAIHLGISVDIAQRKLDTLDSKMDQVLQYLHRCTPPEEKDLAAFVRLRGGNAAVLENDRLLYELVDQRTPTSSNVADGKWGRRHSTMDLYELRGELSEDPEISIARNRETFGRKFEMQEREFERIQAIVHEENKLIIKSVSAGPHDRIRDNDLHNIWREMRWRGNVKARHFVLALRDYCFERLRKLKENEQTFADVDRPTNITEHDEWTLEYISVTRLQAIIEAFDDDASGFITVPEVNAFVASKPQQWSLLHWMSYWAVGWQMTMSRYASEIDHLLEKMFSVKSHILPANRRSVERYLDSVWSPITELTTAFRRVERYDTVAERFQSYVDAEETRLREELARMRYDIDAADTLQLITGPGRIEKNLFPLLYLLLKRDYEIVRLARTVVIHKDELWDSTDTLRWVFRAVSKRCVDLENLFKQQNLDPAQQFKVFSSELFRYWHDPSPLWSTDRLREAHFLEPQYNDAEEDQLIDATQLLNHPVDYTENPLASPQFVPIHEDIRAMEPLKSILGQWSGYIGGTSMFPSEPMLSFHLHASASSPIEFVTSGAVPIGTRYRLKGVVTPDGANGALYTFTIEYAARFWPVSFKGRLGDDGRELSGTWSCKHDGKEGKFFLRQLPPDAMRFWPLPADGLPNKTQVLWQFAICAVRDQVHRKMLSLRLLRARQAVRQRYLAVIRATESERGVELPDTEALALCYRRMTPSEARYFYMMYESRRRISPKHFGISCANCRSDIFGSRVMCLDCGIRTTVDLCERHDCREATIGPDRRDDLISPHLPSHRVLKVRRVVHRHREFGATYRAAQAALIRAEEALNDADEFASSQTPHGHSRRPSAVVTKTEELVNRELSCAGCRAVVSRPCWYCVECDGECFICTACESARTTFSGGHKPNHSLVRCALPRDDSAKAGEFQWSHSRIDDLEDTLVAMQRDSTARFDALDGRLAALEDHSSGLGTTVEAVQTVSIREFESLDARLQRMEALLANVLAKLL